MKEKNKKNRKKKYFEIPIFRYDARTRKHPLSPYKVVIFNWLRLLCVGRDVSTACLQHPE